MKNRISAGWSFFAKRLCIFAALAVPPGIVCVDQSHALANDAVPASGLTKRASWHTPDSTEVINRVRDAWKQLNVAPDATDSGSDELLRRLTADDGDVLNAVVDSSVALVPSIARLKELSQQDPIIAATWFASAEPLAASFDQLPPAMAATVRTWLARELVQQRLYDEALPVFADIEPMDCLDPAAVMFYRSVCRHSLLMKKEALADLKRLLENESAAPVRFIRTAQLMVADIKPLKEDSLDEISRLMTDVTRRLDLGRANSDVQQREQTIIDKLTKLIDDMEEQQKKQQQQQQQQQQSSGGQGQSSGQEQPMNDSRIAGASGQGDVDRKNIAQRDGWGNLPPAEREEALQQISRDLPTHYREAIEAYFRKLATGNN